jgi:hypothetical protein
MLFIINISKNNCIYKAIGIKIFTDLPSLGELIRIQTIWDFIIRNLEFIIPWGIQFPKTRL